VTTASAPAKVILFGEHAVVYGRPAIAVPVTQVQARAVVESARHGQGTLIQAEDLGLGGPLSEASSPRHPLFPLYTTITNTLSRLDVGPEPDLTITITSTIPVARGLGSGAAVATAAVRALALHFGCELAPAEVSELVYQTEILHHGTPSGVDNTVIAYEQPVFFVKGQPIKTLHVRRGFWLAIGDTGVASLTKDAVADVRRAWEQDRTAYEELFDQIGAIAQLAQEALSQGTTAQLGTLMDENQRLLNGIGVGHPALDELVAAVKPHSYGAKLTGAGGGGSMIALTDDVKSTAEAIRRSGGEPIVVKVGSEGVRRED